MLDAFKLEEQLVGMLMILAAAELACRKLDGRGEGRDRTQGCGEALDGALKLLSIIRFRLIGVGPSGRTG